ncbi:tyrosine-type recombinase/integrase [Nonomuraea sp. M3C6]|uniref:Tyrosine-type recombinase/integrase n=1 Tax=Nonomuraea marmarensis TaxID=3351344 RepID=A0ABW7ABV5_9ACTN
MVQVRRVSMAASPEDSWTVLGDDDVPVEPIERYLAFLSDTDKSPNTVKAYAHDLKDYWDFLSQQELDWREVRLEDIGEFISWLRLPPSGREGQVAVLPAVEPYVSATTINRKLAAVSAFYQHHARHGEDVGELLTTWRVGDRGNWKPFLHHISKNRPHAGRAITLKTAKKLPRVLTTEEVQAILNACTRLRDRFLFAVLYDSAVRIGEALGLRHEDIAAAKQEITIVPRHNANQARTKSQRQRHIPVSASLIRLYGDYMHTEYGDLDSDYVFVNLWAEPRGHAMTYSAIYDLVKRIRRHTGLDFDPHWCRHTAATRMLRDGVPLESVSMLLGHSSIATTSAVYGHLTAADARKVLEAAGWFTGNEVAW